MTDLSDYDSYLEKDFDPIRFANGLVLSTNSQDDDNLDLQTPLKRLNFDLKDIEKRIKKSVGNNYTDLIGEWEGLEKFSKAVTALDPAVKQLNSSFGRLDEEILQPYQECDRIHSALKKIHQTSTLLRASIYFLYLISKIEEIDKSDSSLNKRPYQKLVRIAIILNQLKQHLTDSPYMKSLKLVRNYELFQQRLTSRTIDAAANGIRSFTADYDEASMSNPIFALLYLSPGTFYNKLQQLMSTKTNQAVTLVSRNLNNTKNMDRIFNEVSRSATMFARLDNVLRSHKYIDSNGNQTDNTIWDEVSRTLDLNVPLVTGFWRDVATGIEPKFREIASKGGPIARNLRDSKESIRSSIKRAVANSTIEGSDGNAQLEETLMINSTKSLDL